MLKIFFFLNSYLEVIAIPDRRLQQDPDGKGQLVKLLSQLFQIVEFDFFISNLDRRDKSLIIGSHFRCLFKCQSK